MCVSTALCLRPLPRLATYNDLDSARAVMEKGKTAAVFVEPVQGEGGIYPSTKKFLEVGWLQKACVLQESNQAGTGARVCGARARRGQHLPVDKEVPGGGLAAGLHPTGQVCVFVRPMHGQANAY